MQRIRICGPRDRLRNDPKAFLINVTSTSKDWCKAFSPFFLGPVKLYGGHVAQNVENAYQYAKVYSRHIDGWGEVTPAYLEWAKKGWAAEQAHRYPMGKGAKPEFAYWDGKTLGYIEARKVIYKPLYEAGVYQSGKLNDLVALCREKLQEGLTPYFWDFDGYDNVAEGIPLDEVILNPDRTMGHAFVLAQMVEALLD